MFAVAALVLFGWAPATFVYATAPTLVALGRRNPFIRTIFNAGVFGLTGVLAGWVLTQFDADASTASILLRVAVTAVILSTVNLVLVSAAIAASGSEISYPKLVVSNARWLALPFTLMASTALMLVVLWQRTPYLIAALVGPLAAISLYQRSTHQALKAMRLALTDPLTGLGNHRNFQERLQRELTRAEETRGLVSVCSSTSTTSSGSTTSTATRPETRCSLRSRPAFARAARRSGSAATSSPCSSPASTTTRRSRSRGRWSGASVNGAWAQYGAITVSAGVATFPQHGRERDALIRLADGALYWAKEHGKNQVRLAGSVEPEELEVVTEIGDRLARFRAAAALARAVDSRDVYTGSHSERVSAIAGAIAEKLALPAAEIELTRLAGSLHDLGKLAIPEEILQKPGELTSAEWLVVQRHPQIAHRMLESLGVEPVADWVLHHHERWDGSGYPDGLAGEDIPLGSRIVYVAEVYDAMTFGRLYRSPRTRDQALAEIKRHSGAQFDPQVVSAFFSAVGVGEAA